MPFLTKCPLPTTSQWPPIWAEVHFSCPWVLLHPWILSSSFSFHISPSQMWLEPYLEHRDGPLSVISWPLSGEDTIILPCFRIYLVLTWIRIIEILVCPMLLGSARGQRGGLITYLIVHHCLPQWSTESRHQLMWDGWNASRATFYGISIFYCPSQMA